MEPYRYNEAQENVESSDAVPSTRQQSRSTPRQLQTEIIVPIQPKQPSYGVVQANMLLFCSLEQNNPNKIKDIKKYITRGANVNAKYADYNNNTVLHVAVEISDPDVVKYLLINGANPNEKNQDDETPLDLARASNKKEIVNILESFINGTFENLNKTSTVQSTGRQEKTPKKSKQPADKLTNQCRKGTGHKGHVYETKLLALLLFRAMRNKDITSFFLGTNVAGVGDFDDIIFKFYLNNDSTPRFIFVQAKHKDNPDTHKLMVEEVLKMDGNYSLVRYFESYLKVKKRFSINHENEMFKGSFKNCDFYIYTSSKENFNKKQSVVPLTTVDKIMKTNDEDEQIFQFKYDDNDLKKLIDLVAKSRTISLAKEFVNFNGGVKNKYSKGELLEIYHVFFANNVFDGYQQKDGYLEANFSKSFLDNTDDSLLRDLRDTICEGLKLPVGNETVAEGQLTAENYKFKLPTDFGNLDWRCIEKEKSKDYLDKICKIIKKLTEISPEKTLTEIVQETDKYITVRVDESMIGGKKELLHTDVTSIGRLVGKAIVWDSETQMLKFNTKETSEPVKSLIDHLKSNLQCKDLGKFRLDFNLETFPRLALSIEKHDRAILVDFINHLKFFTGQAKEDKVETILKDEINSFYSSEGNLHDSFYRIKGEAINLIFHNKVHHWWNNSSKTYLTENSKFYDEAKNEIVECPLITAAHSIYVSFLKKDMDYYIDIDIRFKDEAISQLKLQDFIEDPDASVLYISSNDRLLCSKKLIQYFKSKNTNFTFLDIDFILANCYNEVILSELTESKDDVYITVFNEIKCDTQTYWNELYNKLPNKKIIIVSNSDSESDELEIKGRQFRHVDVNSLNDFDSSTVECMIKDKFILFQGYLVPFDSIIIKNMYHLIKAEILNKFINGEVIEIGKSLNNDNKFKSTDYYIERRLNRRIKLIGEDYLRKFHVYKNNECDKKNPEDGKDIVVISQDQAMYESICKKHKDLNIHWFVSVNSLNCLWKHTKGSISKLIPHVAKVEDNFNYEFPEMTKKERHQFLDICVVQPQTLKQVNERVSIIGCAAGMGKSSLLRHLMTQTKENELLCVIKVNLFDFANTFKQWKKNEEQLEEEEEKEDEIGLDLNNCFEIMFHSFCAQSDSGLQERKIKLDKKVDGRVELEFKSGESYKINEFLLLEIQILIHMYNEGLVILLLDGFDEISPNYDREGLNLIKVCMDSRFQLLWIASRSYNILNKIEKQANTFSFTLEPLSRKDQIKYLGKMIQKSLYVSEELQNSETWELWMSELLKYISGMLGNNKFSNVPYISEILGYDKFTSVPLHLYMFTEILKNPIESYIRQNPGTLISASDRDPDFSNSTEPDVKSDNYCEHENYMHGVFLEMVFYIINLKLVTLWEKFVDEKFYNIRFGEKKKYLYFEDPDINRLIEGAHEIFVENHKKLAAYVLLDHSYIKILFTEREREEIDELIQQITESKENTGIIDGVDGEGKPKFVHYIYAEYFFADFLCEKLKSISSESLWAYFINEILVSERKCLRNFIDDKFGKHQYLLDHDTSKCILENLLLQQGSNALNTVAESCVNLTEFLLRIVEDCLTKDTINDFINLVTTKRDRTSPCFMCTYGCNLYKSSKIITRIKDIVRNVDSGKIVKLLFCEDFMYGIIRWGSSAETFVIQTEDEQRSTFVLMMETLCGNRYRNLKEFGVHNVRQYILKTFLSVHETILSCNNDEQDKRRVEELHMSTNHYYDFNQEIGNFIKNYIYNAVARHCDTDVRGLTVREVEPIVKKWISSL